MSIQSHARMSFSPGTNIFLLHNQVQLLSTDNKACLYVFQVPTYFMAGKRVGSSTSNFFSFFHLLSVNLVFT